MNIRRVVAIVGLLAIVPDQFAAVGLTNSLRPALVFPFIALAAGALLAPALPAGPTRVRAAVVSWLAVVAAAAAWVLLFLLLIQLNACPGPGDGTGATTAFGQWAFYVVPPTVYVAVAAPAVAGERRLWLWPLAPIAAALVLVAVYADAAGLGAQHGCYT
jgi:hypothetical protein